MSPLASLYTSIDPYASQDTVQRAKSSQIDNSMRWPALLFIVSAVLWLLAGTVLALLASIKLTNPGFLGAFEWLTFGRVRSAHVNAMIYGWAHNAAYAVGLWIMARLGRTEIRHIGILFIAGVFWNISVTIGIAGIFIGHMTSVEWLEMPSYVAPLIVMSYAMIGVWGIIAFRFRQTGHIYISQWYILAALFWFPWIYTVAQMMIFYEPALGTVQSLSNWWFVNNYIGLWLTPIGLGAAYYFIPKVLGRPVHTYYLSLLGFWSLVLFFSWAGPHHLIGGPLPAWVISIGTVASIMLILPIVVAALNLLGTVIGHLRRVAASPTLLFVVFGALMFTLTGLVGVAVSLRSVNEVTHFTHFTVGHAHHGLYGFFTMIMFGAIYFMMPRMVYRQWPSSALIKCHFWFAALGVILMLVALQVGGWIQGLNMNNHDMTFLETVRATIPWLHLRSVSGVLLAIGHVAFAVNLFWMLFAGFRDQIAVVVPFLRRDQAKTTTDS